MTKKAGVGLPNVPPGFERRSVPENQWRGHYAEMMFATVDALKNAWTSNEFGTLNTHDGIPLQSEIDYAIVNFDRHGNFYKAFWHEFNIGGTKDNPHIIDESIGTEHKIRGFRRNVELFGGKWKLGVFSAPGFWGKPPWLVWYDNRLPKDHPVNKDLGVIIEPPPPPLPSPPKEELELLREEVNKLKGILSEIQKLLDLLK